MMASVSKPAPGPRNAIRECVEDGADVHGVQIDRHRHEAGYFGKDGEHRHHWGHQAERDRDADRRGEQPG